MIIKKKIIINKLQIGMFVEELDRPWLETPLSFQGMPITSTADIEQLAKYCQCVYITSKKDMLKVIIKDLQIGMFVVELDRPFLETPFPVQGFRIDSQHEIDEIAKYCQYVYIFMKETTPLKKPAKEYMTHVIPEDSGKKTAFHGDHVYSDSRTFEQEIPEAKKAHKKAKILIDKIKEEIDRDCKLDLDVAKKLVHVIAGSIINNPAAMLFLNQINSNTAQYEHALNTAIHMITFGRHLCLPTDELYILGLGGLLMDIGQLKQPLDSNVNYHNSSEHVLEGIKILTEIPSIPEEVIKITAQHHERENGKGYPNGLSSNQIITYARMAAIVDIYELLISQGINDVPQSPFEALKALWDMTRTGLNATLVQQFAHSIGLFPGGSLVELSTGEVAIVIIQNRTNRLLPTVMIVLDKDKQPCNLPITIDLAAVQDKPDNVYEIVMDLKPGAYGIDPEEYYL